MGLDAVHIKSGCLAYDLMNEWISRKWVLQSLKRFIRVHQDTDLWRDVARVVIHDKNEGMHHSDEFSFHECSIKWMEL